MKGDHPIRIIPVFLLATALAGAALAQPPSVIRRVPPAPAEAARRFAVLAEPPAEWPRRAPAGIVSSPDWSDYNIYPADALVRDEEGLVGIAVLVGADGAARARRVTLSSGHVALDDGTCDLGLAMRFRPALGTDGEPAESVYRFRLRWGLTDAIELAAARMTVLIEVREGGVIDCRTAGDGPIVAAWTRETCRFITSEPGHFLADEYRSAQHATIAVTLRPAGDTSVWDAPRGRLVAARRTEFHLAPNGDLADCRTTRDRGFGPLHFDFSGPCGFFLTTIWIEPRRGEAAPQGGALEIAVYIDR